MAVLGHQLLSLFDVCQRNMSESYRSPVSGPVFADIPSHKAVSLEEQLQSLLDRDGGGKEHSNLRFLELAGIGGVWLISCGVIRGCTAF